MVLGGSRAAGSPPSCTRWRGWTRPRQDAIGGKVVIWRLRRTVTSILSKYALYPAAWARGWPARWTRCRWRSFVLSWATTPTSFAGGVEGIGDRPRRTRRMRRLGPSTTRSAARRHFRRHGVGLARCGRGGWHRIAGPLGNVTHRARWRSLRKPATPRREQELPLEGKRECDGNSALWCCRCAPSSRWATSHRARRSSAYEIRWRFR